MMWLVYEKLFHQAWIALVCEPIDFLRLPLKRNAVEVHIYNSSFKKWVQEKQECKDFKASQDYLEFLKATRKNNLVTTKTTVLQE